MRRRLLALAFALAAISVPASANYVRNGDFSEGELYWSSFSAYYYFDGAYREGSPRSAAAIQQAFYDTAGPLLLEYDYAAISGGYGYATWNGVLVTGSNYSGELTHLSFIVQGTGLDMLAIWGRNEAYYNVLDNVSVTDVGIPEPAGAAILAAGCLGLAFHRRRR